MPTLWQSHTFQRTLTHSDTLPHSKNNQAPHKDPNTNIQDPNPSRSMSRGTIPIKVLSPASSSSRHTASPPSPQKTGRFSVSGRITSKPVGQTSPGLPSTEEKSGPSPWGRDRQIERPSSLAPPPSSRTRPRTAERAREGAGSGEPLPWIPQYLCPQPMRPPPSIPSPGEAAAIASTPGFSSSPLRPVSSPHPPPRRISPPQASQSNLAHRSPNFHQNTTTTSSSSSSLHSPSRPYTSPASFHDDSWEDAAYLQTPSQKRVPSVSELAASPAMPPRRLMATSATRVSGATTMKNETVRCSSEAGLIHR